MDLEELKASWSMLDERLEKTEVVNLCIVREMIHHKTKTAYNGIVVQNVYNFLVNILIVCVVFPYVYMNTPLHITTFAMVECAMVIGLIPIICKLSLLLKFDLVGKSSSELTRLVLSYKKVCHQEKVWVIGSVCLALTAFYILELGFNMEAGYTLDTQLIFPLGLTLLTLALGLVFAKWQLSRHAQQLAEIEAGLQELREFEN